MALPFDLPAISGGYAELTREARALGQEALAAAVGSLSALLGRDVRIGARAVPACGSVRVASARVSLDLPALPAHAALEVEPALVVRLVDLLAGGPGAAAGATALTPVERAALDLFALAAIDGACSLERVERRLAPRLARGPCDVLSPLEVELEVHAGDVAGRARLLVPAAALRALREAPPPDAPALALALPAALRAGVATIAADELDALAPGDVVLFDRPADGLEDLVVTGRVCARGRREDGTFRVEEATMTERRGQLPIALDVEIARLEVPLADLARLEPGMAFPLGVDRRGLVTLRAGERAVARGELVEIDGAVGVRILALEVTP
jgi:type III secretion system YscQ/HrcQ family protein